MLKRVMGKASFCTLQDGSWARRQPHPALRHEGRASATRPTTRSSTGTSGDIIGCRGHAVQDADRRALGAREHAAPADQEPAPAARQVPRHDRPGAEVPPALCRPDHRRRRARALRGAQQGDQLDPPVHGRAPLHGSGNADAAPDPGRRQRQALRHAPQRARPADVPAHRARAVPEAPDRRRLRARVRDQPQLPQRGHLGAAQPRVHDDGVLRRVLEPPRPDGLHRAGAAPRRAPGHRLGEARPTPGARSTSTRRSRA